MGADPNENEAVPMDCDDGKADMECDNINGKNAPQDWKVGQKCFAIWAGNGCYYPAKVNSIDTEKHMMVVDWEDNGTDHRTVSVDRVVTHLVQETDAWDMSRINRVATVRDSETKGRCLYITKDVLPGEIVFVEKPTQVALPDMQKDLWDKITGLHTVKPLQIGTIGFHFAGVLSHLKLGKDDIDILYDKYVPDPDEAPDDDTSRITDLINKEMSEVTKDRGPIDGKHIQRLVSSWRYNSFGHHQTDGLVLYNRISMCSHSCDPSCCWSYGTDDAFVLRARHILKAGDEITISYLQDEDLLRSSQTRLQKSLNWKFSCTCPRCEARVDKSRGFRCRTCGGGLHFASKKPATKEGLDYVNQDSWTLEPCNVCHILPSESEIAERINLEGQYVARVECLDKTDVADVQLVYEAAMEIFDQHWMLYVMDTILWEAHKAEKKLDAMEHLRNRIRFHGHHYARPTFIFAWCHEEYGDCLQAMFPHRKWQMKEEYFEAMQMLAILCGRSHQYTQSARAKYSNTVS